MTCIDCKIKPAAKNRRVCYTCNSRRWAKRHPIKYAFKNLKYNSRRRGKVFKITFATFFKLAIKSTYIRGRGREKDSLHLDRIIEELGYVDGNIQVLKNCDNIKKYLSYDWQTKKARVQKELKLNTNDYPF